MGELLIFHELYYLFVHPQRITIVLARAGFTNVERSSSDEESDRNDVAQNLDENYLVYTSAVKNVEIDDKSDNYKVITNELSHKSVKVLLILLPT